MNSKKTIRRVKQAIDEMLADPENLEAELEEATEKEHPEWTPEQKEWSRRQVKDQLGL